MSFLNISQMSSFIFDNVISRVVMANSTRACYIQDHFPSWDELYYSEYLLTALLMNFPGHTRTYFILLVIALVLFLMLCVLCAVHVYYTWRDMSVDRIRNKLLVLCFIYPVSQTTFCQRENAL